MSGIHDANIRKTDLGALLALHRLLSEQNLSRVGREIGLSQPAMSHLLRRLRLVMGDPLLVREGNALVVTERAARLQDRLELLLPQLLGLFDPDQFDPATSTSHFKLALTDHAGQVLLPAILQRLSALAPNVTTSIAMIPNRQTDLIALDEGRYDLRIGWLRSLPPNWRRRKLLDDQIVLIGSIKNPELAEPMTTDRFLKLGFIGLESDKPIYPNLVDDLLAARGLKRTVVCRVSHFSMVPSLVAETDLVAMFPRKLAEALANHSIAIADPPIQFPPNNVSMAWHPRVHHTPDHVWVRQLISEIASDHSR